MIMKLAPTERFTSRVEAYVKYRATYPTEIIKYLNSEAGFTSESIIADIGSGTGILTKLLLDHSNTVYGVEPNRAMRGAAENYLQDYKNFYSVEGTAENTNLESNSVDFVFAAQAFHWFEPTKTKQEFKRILRSGGKVVLIWNDRDTEHDPFQIKYEAILMRLPEYREVTHKNVDEEKLNAFVSPSLLHVVSFNHFQRLNFESLTGRLLSSSYCPDENSQLFEQIKNEMYEIFIQHQLGGYVKFNYKTMLYWTEL